MKKSLKNKISKNRLREILRFSKKTALEAGKILLKHQKKVGELKTFYKDAQGITGAADLASEKYILSAIKKNFPDHIVLAEEQFFNDGHESYRDFQDAEYTWLIDPLDGTNNFLNSFDYYAVSICLAFKGVPIVGVVYRPECGDLFSAVSGEGASFENISKGSRALKLFKKQNKKKMKESIFVTGFSTEKGVAFREEFKVFEDVMLKSRAVRRIGSAALDMCYVAKGTFDGFWEKGLAPWDVAAAGLICQEAGVKVTDFQGQAFGPFQKSILAVRTPLHSHLKKEIV